MNTPATSHHTPGPVNQTGRRMLVRIPPSIQMNTARQRERERQERLEAQSSRKRKTAADKVHDQPTPKRRPITQDDSGPSTSHTPGANRNSKDVTKNTKFTVRRIPECHTLLSKLPALFESISQIFHEKKELLKKYVDGETENGRPTSAIYWRASSKEKAELAMRKFEKAKAAEREKRIRSSVRQRKPVEPLGEDYEWKLLQQLIKTLKKEGRSRSPSPVDEVLEQPSARIDPEATPTDQENGANVQPTVDIPAPARRDNVVDHPRCVNFVADLMSPTSRFEGKQHMRRQSASPAKMPSNSPVAAQPRFKGMSKRQLNFEKSKNTTSNSDQTQEAANLTEENGECSSTQPIEIINSDLELNWEPPMDTVNEDSRLSSDISGSSGIEWEDQFPVMKEITETDVTKSHRKEVSVNAIYHNYNEEPTDDNECSNPQPSEAPQDDNADSSEFTEPAGEESNTELQPRNSTSNEMTIVLRVEASPNHSDELQSFGNILTAVQDEDTDRTEGNSMTNAFGEVIVPIQDSDHSPEEELSAQHDAPVIDEPSKSSSTRNRENNVQSQRHDTTDEIASGDDSSLPANSSNGETESVEGPIHVQLDHEQAAALSKNEAQEIKGCSMDVIENVVHGPADDTTNNMEDIPVPNDDCIASPSPGTSSIDTQKTDGSIQADATSENISAEDGNHVDSTVQGTNVFNADVQVEDVDSDQEAHMESLNASSSERAEEVLEYLDNVYNMLGTSNTSSQYQAAATLSEERNDGGAQNPEPIDTGNPSSVIAESSSSENLHPTTQDQSDDTPSRTANALQPSTSKDVLQGTTYNSQEGAAGKPMVRTLRITGVPINCTHQNLYQALETVFTEELRAISIEGAGVATVTFKSSAHAEAAIQKLHEQRLCPIRLHGQDAYLCGLGSEANDYRAMLLYNAPVVAPNPSHRVDMPTEGPSSISPVELGVVGEGSSSREESSNLAAIQVRDMDKKTITIAGVPRIELREELDEALWKMFDGVKDVFNEDDGTVLFTFDTAENSRVAIQKISTRTVEFMLNGELIFVRPEEPTRVRLTGVDARFYFPTTTYAPHPVWNDDVPRAEPVQTAYTPAPLMAFQQFGILNDQGSSSVLPLRSQSAPQPKTEIIDVPPAAPIQCDSAPLMAIQRFDLIKNNEGCSSNHSTRSQSAPQPKTEIEEEPHDAQHGDDPALPSGLSQEPIENVSASPERLHFGIERPPEDDEDDEADNDIYEEPLPERRINISGIPHNYVLKDVKEVLEMLYDRRTQEAILTFATVAEAGQALQTVEQLRNSVKSLRAMYASDVWYNSFVSQLNPEQW